MGQPFARRLGFAIAVLIFVLLIPAVIAAQTPPAIPHPLEGRSVCLACHQDGVSGASQIPRDHAGRTDDMCRGCHQPAASVEMPQPAVSATPVVTSAVPAAASPTVRSEERGDEERPPAIPHPLEGRSVCLACHQTGVGGAPRIPRNHAGRTDDMCRGCHQPTVTTAATPTVTAPATPTVVGPLPVPHTLAGHENCLECHISAEATAVPTVAPAVGPVGGPPAIPHSIVGRENCLACHQEGLGGAPKFPADHAGRTNDMCQTCHQQATQTPPAATPAAPSEPIPTPIVYPAVEGANTCLDCHSKQGGKQADIADQWTKSVHAERNVACADCHGGNPAAVTADEAMSPAAGFIGVPAKADVPALCGSCHADVSRMRQYGLPTDQYAQYNESTHGMRLAQGDRNVATCYDCHGGHLVLRPNDPSSTVYPANVPRMCADCHSNQALMASYGIPTNQFDLYRQSVHGHLLFDGQDVRAPTCATCHGTHGAAPPGINEVASVCGTCHSATQADFDKSPHARIAAEGPRCSTCHGYHDVPLPGEALYVGAEPRHCGACHAPDSPPGQLAQSLHDTIATAAQAYDGAEAAIQSAGQLGMLVSPLEQQLREANTDLITARAAQHALDITTVRARADGARSIAEKAKAGANAQVGESIFRRQAMVVAVAVMGLIILALYVLKKELDRRLDGN